MAKKNILVFVSDIKSEQNYLLAYLPIIVKKADIYLVPEKTYTYLNYNSFYKKNLDLIKKLDIKYIKTNLLFEVINSNSIKHFLKLILNFFFRIKYMDLFSNIFLIKKYFKKRNIKLDYIFLHESNLRKDHLDNFLNEKIYLFQHSLVMRGCLIEKKRRISINKFIYKTKINLKNYENLFFIINFYDEKLILQKKYNRKLNILDFKSPLINNTEIKNKKFNKTILLVLGKLNYFKKSYKKEVDELIENLIRLNFKIYIKFHPRSEIGFVKNKDLIIVDDCVSKILTKIDLAIVTSKTNTVLEIVSHGICVLEFYNSKYSTFKNKKYEFKKNNKFISISNYFQFNLNFDEQYKLNNFLNDEALEEKIKKIKLQQSINLKKYLSKNYSKNIFSI